MIEDFFYKTLPNNFKFFVYDEGTKVGKNFTFLKTTSKYIINRKNESILIMTIFVYQVKITEMGMLCKHHIEYE